MDVVGERDRHLVHDPVSGRGAGGEDKLHVSGLVPDEVVGVEASHRLPAAGTDRGGDVASTSAATNSAVVCASQTCWFLSTILVTRFSFNQCERPQPDAGRSCAGREPPHGALSAWVTATRLG
jgi:hypothetical protein